MTIMQVYREYHHRICGSRFIKTRGCSSRLLIGTFLITFLFVFEFTPVVNIWRRFWSNCVPVEKITSTSHCPVSALLEDHSVLGSVHRLRSCHVVLYNRVPKCASRSVLSVIKQLACQNGFRFLPISNVKNEFYTQENLVTFTRSLMSTDRPIVASGHIHFVNFSSLNSSEPVYVNVVRDPLQRALSHYFYNTYGSNNKPLIEPRQYFNKSLEDCVRSGFGPCWGMNVLLPYFCGHHPTCRKGGDIALRRAKRTVREKYLLVGLTEDLPAFMETLSFLMPHFFRNATVVYKSLSDTLWQKFKTYKKPQISKETEQILRDHLGLEYEFYEFVRQRFYHFHQRVRQIQDNTYLQGIWDDNSGIDTTIRS